MSGSGLPYRLRPNKYVDREMFAEFVSVLTSAAFPDDYVYISMGGHHLSDHVAVYRRAGIKNLYAFDFNGDVVDRQRFNAPFDGVRCEAHGSGELGARLDRILEGFGAKNAIIWLDYTEAKRLSQLGEVEEISKNLVVGDVLRITMNASFDGLHRLESQLKREQQNLPRSKKNAVLLGVELGSYMKQPISSIDHGGMVKVLSESVGRACKLGCEKGSGGCNPIPVMINQYQDTTRMLTVTILISESGLASDIPSAWHSSPNSWGDVQQVVAPDLSPREKYALDHQMHKSPDEVAEKLGFPLEKEAIRSYEAFHRYYPSFSTVID